MRLTRGIIDYVAPIGVFGLIVNLVGTTGLGAFQALAWYALMLACGLALPRAGRAAAAAVPRRRDQPDRAFQEQWSSRS